MGAATFSVNEFGRFQLYDQELKKGGGKTNRPTAQDLQVKWAAKNTTGTKGIALVLRSKKTIPPMKIISGHIIYN